MNYIINPMWFYWIGMLDSLLIVSILISIVLGIILIVAGITSIVSYSDYGKEDENFKSSFKVVKIVSTLLSIVLMITIFVPSKQTIYTMMTAKLVTTDNMQIVKEEGKELIEFLTEQIEDLIDTEEED